MLFCPLLFRDQGAAMALETAFTMDSSAIKFGPGVTSEVEFDMRQLVARRVIMLTDPGLSPSQTIDLALRALRSDTTPVDICWANG
jgi:hydroxyacid-oxoacid transhydrogenase